MGQALEMCVNCETKRSCDTCTDLHNWIMEHLEPKQEWISVNDRLPEKGQKVIICMKRKDGMAVDMGEYSGKSYWFSFGAYITNVTHWMPLPEPPKEEE